MGRPAGPRAAACESFSWGDGSGPGQGVHQRSAPTGVQGRIPAWEGSGFPVGRVPWRKGPTTAACQAVNFARRGGCGAAAIGKSWADFGGRGPAGGGFGPREANGGVGLACGALLECGPDGVFEPIDHAEFDLRGVAGKWKRWAAEAVHGEAALAGRRRGGRGRGRHFSREGWRCGFSWQGVSQAEAIGCAGGGPKNMQRFGPGARPGESA